MANFWLWMFVLWGSAVALRLSLPTMINKWNQRKEKHSPWWEALVRAQMPLALVIYALAAMITLQTLPIFYGDIDLTPAMMPMKSLTVVLVGFFFAQYSRHAGYVIAKSDSADVGMEKSTAYALSSIARVVIWVLTFLIVFQTLGFNLTSLVALGGVGGLAISFAAKDMLANFFGGLSIYLDKPFSVGDWIRSPDREIEGTVEDIGWRHVLVRTFDKRPLYVPCAAFTSISVENPSRMTNRRIKETMGVRYKDSAQLEAITQEVRAYLKGHADIDQGQTIIVNFDKFNASSLDFFIYCFTRTKDWIEFHQVKEAVLLDIVKIVHKNGADFAFPTRTHYIEPKEEG